MDKLQFSDINGDVLGMVLAILLIVCTLYAAVVRWMEKHGMKDLVVWQVIFGTLIVLAGLYFVWGIVPTVIALLGFAAGGFPMVIEYITRVQGAKKADEEAAKAEQRGLLK